MISTAFLFNVIIFGLIAAVILPVIDLIFFVIRESGCPGFHPHEDNPDACDGSPASERQRLRLTRNAHAPLHDPLQVADSPARPNPASRADSEGRLSLRADAEGRCMSRADAEGRAHPQSRPFFSENVPDIVPRYVASNGITVTPSVAGFRRSPTNAAVAGDPYAAPSSHPHAEYWSYGSARFYEGR